MKISLKVLLIICFLTSGCLGNKKISNQFSSSDDTLIIRTEKHKGDGLFSLGTMLIELKDTTEKFADPIAYPKQVTNIKRMEMPTDNRAKEPYFVDFITGKLDDKEILIVDENNNNDFSDDSIRIIKQIKWKSDDNLIKCKYLISNGHKIVLDSSWLRIGTWHDNFWAGRSEHLIADFTINKEKFKVGIIDTRLFGFFYGIYPEAAIISQNTETKDTLVQKDLLKIGEILNLGGNFYRFDNITNNGEYITLVKEKNFDKIIGTQVGVIAPDFVCKTVSGDTIESSSLHDRIMIIANSCGCGGDSLSTQAYYDIMQEYGSIVYLLRLDSKIDKGLDGLQIDMAEKFNKDIYIKFRNEYCSRLCYVIDKNNRILDKFPVEKWKSNLPEHIKP
jgi:hypothetical protein